MVTNKMLILSGTYNVRIDVVSRQETESKGISKVNSTISFGLIFLTKDQAYFTTYALLADNRKHQDSSDLFPMTGKNVISCEKSSFQQYFKLEVRAEYDEQK
jgi:hypothetical protein